MFDFSNYSARSKYNDNSSQLVVGKMKDGTTDVNNCSEQLFCQAIKNIILIFSLVKTTLAQVIKILFQFLV